MWNRTILSIHDKQCVPHSTFIWHKKRTQFQGNPLHYSNTRGIWRDTADRIETGNYNWEKHGKYLQNMPSWLSPNNEPNF